MSGFLLVRSSCPPPPRPPLLSKASSVLPCLRLGRRELRGLQESESKKGLHEDLTTGFASKDKQLADGIQSRDLENLDRTRVPRRNAGGEQERRPWSLKRFLVTVSLQQSGGLSHAAGGWECVMPLERNGHRV